MKTNLKRTAITFLILCPSLFLLHSIAWADIFFWKTGIIAIICGTPTSIVFWPLSLIPVKPGSSIDGPYFWIPLVILTVIAWSWVIQWLIHKMKKTEDRTRGSCLS